MNQMTDSSLVSPLLKTRRSPPAHTLLCTPLVSSDLWFKSWHKNWLQIRWRMNSSIRAFAVCGVFGSKPYTVPAISTVSSSWSLLTHRRHQESTFHNPQPACFRRSCTCEAWSAGAVHRDVLSSSDRSSKESACCFTVKTLQGTRGRQCLYLFFS